MALQVIGAGFGRTGTNSLKVALEQLGFWKCHHMREVPGSRAQVDAWYALSQGEEVDWDRVFDGFAASCDWPSAVYWERLYRHYPDSVVILTVRDEDRWYESVAETIYPVSRVVPRWLVWSIPRVRKLLQAIMDSIWDGIFDGKFEDKTHAISVYRANSARVKRVVAPERLLVFEAKDGWEPLCAFLNVPVPDSPYPHVNEAAEIKRMVRLLRALGWLPLVLVAGVLAAVLSW